MGLIKEAFGWMVGIKKTPIDQINVQELENKLRATERLRTAWDRDRLAAEKEYANTISVEAMAGKTPIGRKLAFQRGAIVAKRVKSLTSAVMMLDKMSGAVAQLKEFKRFYEDLQRTTMLPKGLNIDDAIRQVYAATDSLEGKKAELDTLLQGLDDVAKATSLDEPADEITPLMDDLNKLYDEYNDKKALKDEAGASEVQARIDAKRLEIDRKMGVGALN